MRLHQETTAAIKLGKQHGPGSTACYVRVMFYHRYFQMALFCAHDFSFLRYFVG